MPDAATVPAYDGLVVADLSRRMAGAFAARLFADHGADVVLLEPPDGHPLRHEAPFLDDQPGPERSALHAYINWNKRSAVLSNPSEAEPWIAAADLVITTDGPTTLSQWPLSALRPDAVHLSVTPFGLEGSLADAPRRQPHPQRALRLGARQRHARRAAPLPALPTVRLHRRTRRLRRRDGSPPPTLRIQRSRARRCPRTRSHDPHGLPVDDRRDLPGHGLVARRDRRPTARRTRSALGRRRRSYELRLRRLAQLARSDGPFQPA